ncbi:transcriptional repressor [Paracoccus sp. PS-1]|nr:transcriptional repressor [Paracoccus sp. J39]MDQ7262073.1 transcriptional repressor [Paracoccus sp. PS1]
MRHRPSAFRRAAKRSGAVARREGVDSRQRGHPATGRALHERSAWATRISIATVYRTVSTLESCGLVERHSFADGRARFETNGSGHHDHFINAAKVTKTWVYPRPDRP